MKRLVKTKIFAFAFFATYFTFFFVTVFLLDIKRDGFGEGSLEFGFPFAYYHSTCFGGGYFWTGLAGNMIVAAVLSCGAGLAAACAWSRISSPEFRAKWYL